LRQWTGSAVGWDSANTLRVLLSHVGRVGTAALMDRAEARIGSRETRYFLVPNSPPRFSGRANPGGGVAGSCAGGFGIGGFGVLVAIA
jgi:hypothetical protein